MYSDWAATTRRTKTTSDRITTPGTLARARTTTPTRPHIASDTISAPTRSTPAVTGTPSNWRHAPTGIVAEWGPVIGSRNQSATHGNVPAGGGWTELRSLIVEPDVLGHSSASGPV